MTGRVIHTGQVVIDLTLRIEAIPEPGGDVFADESAMAVGGGFNVLAAARRLSVETLYAGPLGAGPFAEAARQALKEIGVDHIGPLAPGDQGYCVAMTDARAERTFISTKGAETMAPASAWADFVRTMHPGDVLYIDGYLMDHPANREAAEAALRALPEGVHVLLDVSPVIGIPEGLPSDDVIVSMNHREAQEVAHRSGDASIRNRALQPREAARGVLAELDRPVLVRAGAEGAYFVRPTGTAPNARNEDVIHIPTPHIEAIDTNGAGDAHSGVLAASLAQGIPTERALLLANCAGALSATVVGPASGPTREEIEAAASALEERADAPEDRSGGEASAEEP